MMDAFYRWGLAPWDLVLIWNGPAAVVSVFVGGRGGVGPCEPGGGPRVLSMACHPERPEGLWSSEAVLGVRAGLYSETAVRCFYDFYRGVETGPMINPFPLDRSRRGGWLGARASQPDGVPAPNSSTSSPRAKAADPPSWQVNSTPKTGIDPSTTPSWPDPSSTASSPPLNSSNSTASTCADTTTSRPAPETARARGPLPDPRARATTSSHSRYQQLRRNRAKRGHHRSGSVIRHASTALSASRRWPVTSSPT